MDEFDPSALVYSFAPKIFPKDDLLIVLVGNGGPIDNDFRHKHKLNADSAFQQHINGHEVTYVALDLNIFDDNKRDLFYVAGFDVSQRLTEALKRASSRAVKTRAYDFILRSIKSAKDIKS
jgi:hypothetical protein